MRVIAADSGCSILNERYEPTCVVCTVAVLVEPPYRAPKALSLIHISEPTRPY